jgi:hypothetical protein
LTRKILIAILDEPSKSVDEKYQDNSFISLYDQHYKSHHIAQIKSNQLIVGQHTTKIKSSRCNLILYLFCVKNYKFSEKIISRLGHR